MLVTHHQCACLDEVTRGRVWSPSKDRHLSCGCNGVQSPVHTSHVPLWAAAGRLTNWRRLSAGFRPQPDLLHSGKIPDVLGSSDSDAGLPGSLGTNPIYSKLKLIRTEQFHLERCQEVTLNRTQISP